MRLHRIPRALLRRMGSMARQVTSTPSSKPKQTTRRAFLKSRRRWFQAVSASIYIVYICWASLRHLQATLPVSFAQRVLSRPGWNHSGSACLTSIETTGGAYTRLYFTATSIVFLTESGRLLLPGCLYVFGGRFGGRHLSPLLRRLFSVPLGCPSISGLLLCVAIFE